MQRRAGRAPVHRPQRAQADIAENASRRALSAAHVAYWIHSVPLPNHPAEDLARLLLAAGRLQRDGMARETPRREPLGHVDKTALLAQAKPQVNVLERGQLLRPSASRFERATAHHEAARYNRPERAQHVVECGRALGGAPTSEQLSASPLASTIARSQ